MTLHLPSSTPNRGGTSLPVGLLGMLVLVAAFEAFVARNWLDFSDPVALNWRVAARAAAREAPGQDVLCLGDSLVKHGLIPQVLQARTGLRVYNLAAARSHAPATYWLLRRALEAGARPQALVVDFKPTVLIGGTDAHLRYWQEIATPRECLDLALSGRFGSFLTPLVVGRLLPSYRGRLEIRSNLMAALRGERDRLFMINRSLAKNWEVNRGAHLAAKNPAFHDELIPEHEYALVPKGWYCHSVNAVYLKRVFELAAAREIPVYWVLPPLAPRLQARREPTANEAGYLRLVREIARQFPNVTVLDGRHAGYDPSLFIDPTHLDVDGGYALSLDVAEVLRRDRSGRPSGSRWIDLPRYRKRPTPIPLEDIEETKLALMRDLNVR